MTFCIIVGQASFQTAGPTGPSTSERSYGAEVFSAGGAASDIGGDASERVRKTDLEFYPTPTRANLRRLGQFDRFGPAWLSDDVHEMSSTPGYWLPAAHAPADFGGAGVVAALDRADEPVWVVARDAQPAPRLGVGFGGHVSPAPVDGGHPSTPLLPALHAERLGDRGFCEEHGARYAYVAGSMATGIASVDLVTAAARHGLLAYFGAGGLRFEQVQAGVEQIFRNRADRPGAPWGVNLIHSPDQPGLEDALVDFYLARGVTRIEASAFMDLAPSVGRYASTGLRCDPYGRIVRPNRVMAKISRPEVARHFLRPPPAALLGALVAAGALTQDEARRALLPVADDVTCEADSGGHTVAGRCRCCCR